MLANNIIRQFVTQFIGLISSFVISIITARILGPENRGEFSMLLNTSGFICLLFGFNFGTSLVYIVSSNKMPIRRTINSFFLIVIILIVICCISLFLYPSSLYKFIMPNDGNSTTFLFVLFGIFSLTISGTLYNAILSGKKMFKQLQLLFLITSSISIIAYLLLYFYREQFQIDVKFFSFFYLALTLFPSIGYYIIYYKKVKPEMAFVFLTSTQLKYILSFSMMAYLCSIFHFLSCRIDFWIVEYYNGSKDLGIYSLGVNLVQMLWILPQAISVILLSYSGDSDKEKSNSNTNTLSRIAFTTIILVAVFLFFTIDFFMEHLFGKDYSYSAFIFKILLIGVVPFSITTILSSHFAGSGQIKVNLYCSLIGFLCCLILDFILIPKFGTTGAAIASCIAFILSTAYIITIYIVKTKGKLLDLILIKSIDITMIKQKIKQLKK